MSCSIRRLLILACVAFKGAHAGSVHDADTLAPLPVQCVHQGSGSEYQIGPGVGQIPSLGALDWSSLQPGDTVRIFWRAQPYAEKLLIAASGSETQPITICGVPEPVSGDLPTITGVNAVTSPQFDFGDTPSNLIEDMAVLLIWNPDYWTRPSHLRIEGLRIEGAQPEIPGSGLPNSYSSAHHGVRAYDSFAACIRIQEGHEIQLRGNALRHCSQGLFALSRDGIGDEQLSTQLRVVGNVLYGNGNVGAYTEHNAYVQGIDVVYEFNYFGANKPGALGGNLKDRSAGTVIRYNWFESAARIIDLVEVQEHRASVLLDRYFESVGGEQNADPDKQSLVAARQVMYSGADVYGNTLDMTGSTAAMSALLHYGADGQSQDRRRGTLRFYHNTVHARASYNSPVGMSRFVLFDQNYPDDTARVDRASRIDMRNNLFWMEPEFTAPQAVLNVTRNAGETVILGTNLFFPGWNQDPDFPAYQGLGPGYATVETIGSNWAAASKPLDSRLLPLTGSEAVGVAAALPVAEGFAEPLWQFHPGVVPQPRIAASALPSLGAAEPDLGATIFHDGFE